MKKLVLSMLFVLMFASSVFAVSANFYSKFINKEIIIYVALQAKEGNTRVKEIPVVLKKIDSVNNVLSGLVNNGTIYIPIENILYIVEQLPNVHAVIDYSR